MSSQRGSALNCIIRLHNTICSQGPFSLCMVISLTYLTRPAPSGKLAGFVWALWAWDVEGKRNTSGYTMTGLGVPVYC
jgi:hypothetical protein